MITPLPGFTRVVLAEWAERHLRPETDVYSDGLGVLRAVIDQGHAHTIIESQGSRAAIEAAGARWVNIVHVAYSRLAVPITTILLYENFDWYWHQTFYTDDVPASSATVVFCGNDAVYQFNILHLSRTKN